jgi:hypothetical protein
LHHQYERVSLSDRDSKVTQTAHDQGPLSRRCYSAARRPCPSGLRRQVRNDLLADHVVAEDRLIFTKAEASELGTEIDGRALAGHGSAAASAKSKRGLRLPTPVFRPSRLRSPVPHLPIAPCSAGLRHRRSQPSFDRVPPVSARIFEFPIKAAITVVCR